MENQYEYTPELAKEAIATWYQKKFVVARVILAGIIPLSFVLMFCSPSVRHLLLCGATLLLALFYQLKRRALIQNECKRLEMLYTDAYPQFCVTLGDAICLKTPTSERAVEYCNVQKVAVSKHLIVLMLQGDMTIALRKDGFTTGAAEECLALLADKMKR